MNYKELNEAIDNGLRAKSKYKFQVICFMSQQRALKANKQEICEYMVKCNQGATKQNGNLIDYKHYMSCPVWKALEKTDQIITIDGSLITLKIEMTNEQREKIKVKCQGIYKLD